MNDVETITFCIMCFSIVLLVVMFAICARRIIKNKDEITDRLKRNRDLLDLHTRLRNGERLYDIQNNNDYCKSVKREVKRMIEKEEENRHLY